MDIKKSQKAGDFEPLWDDEACAAYLGISPKSLPSMRFRGTSPPFIKLGRGRSAPIRYEPQAVVEWVRGQVFLSTAEAAA